MKTFRIGQIVTYVPNHADGDTTHRDCERGRVISLNAHYVFVQFSTQPNPQACRAENLVP